MIFCSFSYKRSLLKPSGEALVAQESYGIDLHILIQATQNNISIYHFVIRIYTVSGGNNIIYSLDRVPRGRDSIIFDHINVLINKVVLQYIFAREGINARLQSAILLEKICKVYNCHYTVKHFEKYLTFISIDWSSNLYSIINTAILLHSNQTNCNASFKNLRVKNICLGNFTEISAEIPKAAPHSYFTYKQDVQKNFRSMGAAVIVLRDNKHLAIVVLCIFKLNHLYKLLREKSFGQLSIYQSSSNLYIKESS